MIKEITYKIVIHYEDIDIDKQSIPSLLEEVVMFSDTCLTIAKIEETPNDE